MVYRKSLVVDGITPVGAYASLRRDGGQGSFLLESVVLGERWGRYSILGYRPRRNLVVMPEAGVEPFRKLAELIPTGLEPAPDVASRFATAHVGMVGYDSVHYTTKVGPWPTQNEPLARLVGEATVAVFDNLEHTAVIGSIEASEVQRAEAELRQLGAVLPLNPPDPNALPSDVEVTMSDRQYGQCVKRVGECIRAGDTFQTVLARTFSTPIGRADPLDVYRALRVLSPARICIC